MIDDIVQLPRPLATRRGNAVLASYTPYELPDSPLGNYFGVSDPLFNRDLPVCIGNEFSLLTGKDAPYRYKFIEHTKDEIVEYVTIADGPLDSLRTKTWTLWVNHVDKGHLNVKREYCWDNIIAAREHFGFKPVKLMSKEVESEVDSDVGVIYPGLARHYAWTHHPGCVFADEDKEVERLMTIRENVKCFNDAWNLEYMPLGGDVFRGCTKDEPKKVRIFTHSGSVIPYHVMTPADLKKLRSPYFKIGPYGRCLIRKEGIDNAIIDGLTEYSGWFDLLKYIEAIPYGEVFLQFAPHNFDVMRVYDPYDEGAYFDIDVQKACIAGTAKKMQKDVGVGEDDRTPTEIAANSAMDILVNIRDLVPSFKSISVYRSWGEETYITIMKKNGETTRFYFDMFHIVMGTRLLEESQEPKE